MKKRILILVLLIFVLFSVHGVCASDFNDTSIASEDTEAIKLSQSENNDEKSNKDDDRVIKQSNDEEIISNGNVGTFSELQNKITAISGNTLELDRNYEYDVGFASSEIEIDKKITIDGKGYTIDAKGKSRIFNIQAFDVVIKNITFKNANFALEGSAVMIRYSGSISNCNFINNSAGGSGVIRMGSGIVSHCNFSNNHAYLGGAVYFSSVSTVENCNFTNNSAVQGGCNLLLWKG